MRFFLSLCAAILFLFPLLEGESDGSSNSLPFLIIVYGPQGSGKAAIAARLHVDFNLPIISPASSLSSNVLDETPLGNKARDFVVNGSAMPPGLISSVLCDRLLESDCSDGALIEDGVLGLKQIQAIQDCLSSRFQFLAINIETSEDWIIQSAENRWFCRSCGLVYEFQNDRCAVTCDLCSCPLSKRQADSSELLSSKIHDYEDSLAPLLAWYREQKTLVQVAGDRTFEDIYEDVATLIQTKTGLRRAQSQLFTSEDRP